MDDHRRPVLLRRAVAERAEQVVRRLEVRPGHVGHSLGIRHQRRVGASRAFGLDERSLGVDAPERARRAQVQLGPLNRATSPLLGHLTGVQVLGVLGASVQNIPGGEIYQALASGQVDGAEWIGPYADERMGFQEVTSIYYTSGFHEPGSALTLLPSAPVT